ncbi:hypothetical protein [Halomicrobium salinisoli]|uniref:hypothetical protein n=1 Tax=Halomicrobium salinisoli TaxID=2878391 RepID=UPI001CF00EB6|nr:hypothetical protein [Halomicrobium salinisoli]
MSSYVPLFLILSIELNSYPPVVISNKDIPAITLQFSISRLSILLLLLSAVLAGFLAFLLFHHSGHRTQYKRCDHFQQRNELLSSYLLAYVFVFVGLDFYEASDWLIFLIFFGMLAVLHMRSEMLHINPLLGLVGYRVYEVESDDHTLLVITGDDIRENMKIPESQKDQREPDYLNIEVIELGPNTYITPSNDNESG